MQSTQENYKAINISKIQT